MTTQPSAFYQWLESKLQPFTPLLIFYPHWTQHNRMVVIYKALNDLYEWDKCTLESLRNGIISNDADSWEYEAFRSVAIDWILTRYTEPKTKESYENNSKNDTYNSRAVLIADVGNIIVANIKFIKKEDGLLLFEATSGEAVGMAVDEDEAIGKMLASGKPCLRASYPCLSEKNWIVDIALCD